jgi:hypothetical protein
MPTPTLVPIILGNALLTFGADEYQGHVSSATFTPSSSIVNWRGLTPTSSYSFPVTATWTLDLELAQDWESADALSRYLFENEGETVSVTFEPVNGGETVTADVIITPGAIGGAVDAVAVSSVSLGVKGKPVLSAVA